MSNTKKPVKRYLNGLFIREFVFDNGGKVLKTTFTRQFVDQLLEEMEQTGKDSIRCVISKRKEVTDTGISHCSYFDPWEPEKDYNDTNDPQYDKKEDDEDLPF
jgi:hypothetical protein